MMRLFPTVLAVLFTTIGSFVSAQTPVEMLNGGAYEGSIVSETETEVALMRKDSSVVVLRRDMILGIGDYKREQTAFWSVGAGAGLPLVYNLIAGYNSDALCLRLSGGYLVNYKGAQLNIGKRLTALTQTSLSITAGLGYSDSIFPTEEIIYAQGNDPVASHIVSKRKRWQYATIGLDYNFHGLFADAGIVLFNNVSVSPFVFQLGYVYEFR